MTKRSKKLWPWALGAMLGLVAGVLYLGVPTVDASAGDDDALVFAIDPSRDARQSDIEALVQFMNDNPGRDVILQPAVGYQVPSAEERRQRDQERADAEAAELALHVEQGLADGTYVTGGAERPDCATAASASAASGAPGRHLVCEGQVVAAPGRLELVRAATPGQDESLLETRLHDLFAGVTPDEAALGYSSYFSNPAILQSVTLAEDGAVTVDFNAAARDQLADVHPGLASHNLLQQIFRTLFQFRDVSSVEITFEGSCDAFGDLIAGPCQRVDRGLWEQMLYENGESVAYFNLKGGN